MAILTPIFADVYTDGFSEAIGSDGCIRIPEELWLRATYDWDYIEKNSIGCLTVEDWQTKGPTMALHLFT